MKRETGGPANNRLRLAPHSPADRSQGTSDPGRRHDRQRGTNADRGVSDIVGFVLTVGIILIGVGIVGTVGVDQIEQFQGTQNVENAKRAMTVLSGNMDQLEQSRAVSLTSELAVQNGRMAVGSGSGNSEVTVEFENSSGTYQVANELMRTIRYRTEDTGVVYEGGAVILDNPEGESIPLRDPSFVCSEDRAVVSFVSISSASTGQGYSGSTAGVTTRLAGNEIHFPTSRRGSGSIADADRVKVTVDSEYEAAWRSFLEGNGWTQVATSPPEYRCDTGEALFVRQVVVDVEVSR